jgi:hypothetical protein
MHNYSDFEEGKRAYYEKMLGLLGSLSRLFSENNAPYFDSRIAENLYCLAFGAENKGRDDSSFDAVYNKTGIGIKTFIGNSAQKIAEFNKDLLSFSGLPTKEKVIKIAELRNKRIDFTKRAYGLEDAKYHCIRREDGKILIYEYPMDLIDINNITEIRDNGKSLKFSDGKNKYNFNISKSVLMKHFSKENPCSEIDVKILDDPFEVLAEIFEESREDILDEEEKESYEYVILPLYSIKNGNKIVPLKSGLNQWNAGGRNRNEDEVYIKIPMWIHRKFPDFFPSRKAKFELKLPDEEIISAKVCQQDNKALMSDPNKVLGSWILRKVLQLERGKLLEYKTLQEIGIDSVIVHKISDEKFQIDFRGEGEFEKFEEENKN